MTESQLFSMGPPIKASSGDRHFCICCAHCEDDVAGDFEGYFAKVNP